ncbi:MAG TPA: hypothetical protein VEC37_18170 [Bacillota bacterium]|nr:hypothetical protein [Bacillota bacterium]
MNQLKQWTIILVVIVSLLFCGPVMGYERMEICYRYQYPELTRLTSVHPEALRVYGEVIQISPNKVTIRTKDGILTGSLNSNTLIYCNGIRSSWRALLPVATEAFFEARVFVKGQKVLAIDGFYYGEEVAITGWEYSGDRLKLKLFSLCRQTTEIRFLSDAVHCPRIDNWLSLNQNVFVLYGADETVRAVYLH